MEEDQSQVEHYRLMEQHSAQALTDLRAALYHFRQLQEEARRGDLAEMPPFAPQLASVETVIRLLEYRHNIWSNRLAMAQAVAEDATGYY